MPPTSLRPITLVSKWTCRSCRLQSRKSLTAGPLKTIKPPLRELSTSSRCLAEAQAQVQVQAAPEIDFRKRDQDREKRDPLKEPARIIPVSSSYFTTLPVFNDHILQLKKFMNEFGTVPVIRAEEATRRSWMTLEQVRDLTGEKVGAAKYSQLLRFLRRLNTVHPSYASSHLTLYLRRFQRPGAVAAAPRRPSLIDEFGRSTGVGRRKSSVAKASLVEGTGEILINGKSIIQAFPRIHDRESALWPLQVTNRVDKYNAFVLTHGGGLTGQAESVTLAIAKALLVHEPALKPALRKAGCITRIMKRVERKKPGHLKARKMPTWVKR